MSGDAASSLRLFFALWPQEEVRKQLTRLAIKIADQHGGRCVRSENLHLTLAFIGQVDSGIVPVLRQAGSAVHRTSFNLLLDKLHYWGKDGIISAGISQPCSELAALAQDLREQFSAAGIRYDTVKFVPHVTLVRNAKREPEQKHFPETIPPVAWTAARWSLVQSRLTPHGPVYQSLADWVLASQDSDEHHRA